MKKIFWMLIGASLAVLVITRGRILLRRLTPQGIAEKVERRGSEAAADFGSLFATFKTSMETREAQLRRELKIDAS